MADRIEPGLHYRVCRGPYRDIVVILADAQTPEGLDGQVIVQDARPGASHEFYVRPDEVERWGEGPTGVREPRRPAPEPPALQQARPTHTD